MRRDGTDRSRPDTSSTRAVGAPFEIERHHPCVLMGFHRLALSATAGAGVDPVRGSATSRPEPDCDCAGRYAESVLDRGLSCDSWLHADLLTVHSRRGRRFAAVV